MDGQSCMDCVHYDQDNDSNQSGPCRRYAPHPGAAEHDHLGAPWPRVFGQYDRCGELEAKEAGKQLEPIPLGQLAEPVPPPVRYHDSGVFCLDVHGCEDAYQIARERC